MIEKIPSVESKSSLARFRCQISPYLTMNVPREIHRIKSAFLSVSKPWIFTFALALLVSLTLTFGTRTLHADEADVLVTEPQWIQTKGLGGVSRPGLFVASDQTLYLIAKTGLYRFTEEADEWTLINSGGPSGQFDQIMAERGDALYLLTPDELLASTDRGKTWEALGARPKGHPIALVVTDTPQERSVQNAQNADVTMYLVLETEVFRSEDGGKQWVAIGEGLRTDIAPEEADIELRIHDATAIDNIIFAGENHIIFVGTNRGIFRFTGDWEKVTLPTLAGVNSLAATENRLYVATISGQPDVPHCSLFYSTDFGDSWTDITPSTAEHPVKLIGTVKIVSVGDTLMVIGIGGVLLSYDHGRTWKDPGRDPHAFTGGFLPVVALDENNFFKSQLSGVTRSTDGGRSWHPFVKGLGSADVQNLIADKNMLYVVSGGKVAQSANRGESWEAINVSGGGKLLIPRIETANEILYVSSIASHRTQLFHLPVESNELVPVQGIPDFKEDNLYVEWKKRLREARETNVKVRETERLWRESLLFIAEEDTRNGGFVLAGETVFMEHRRKLFRWRPGETAWHYTGLEDQGELPPIDGKGFTLAASGDTIYAGKREGDLFQSLDNGDTWNDITESLAFSFEYFKDIVFAGSTVYISTDMGVMRSLNSEVWHTLTDTNGQTLLMDWIAAEDATLYGVCHNGVYRVDDQTDTWRQIASEAPYAPTSLAIADEMLYIGTKHSGIFRFQRDGR